MIDVAIVGAGPAGSVAGAMLARRGHSVVTLEASTFPRFQIGESLLPRSVDLLEEAGLLRAVEAQGFMPKAAAVFLEGASRDRYAFADAFPGQRPQTYQVPRAEFDQTLATEATRTGVDVRYAHRVDAVQFDEAGATLRVTDLEVERAFDLRARKVLDCSGYGRVLARLLGLEAPPTLGPRRALFTHVEGDRRPSGQDEGDIWVCIHPRGAWIWIIPFSNGRTSVGVVGPKELFEGHGSDRDALFALLRSEPNAAARLEAARPVLRTQRLEGWTTSVTRTFGPGWVVTGNAGDFLDPVFSSGVTLAMESAALAAKLFDRELSGGAVEWASEYGATMTRAVASFKCFVDSWYSGDLPKILLTREKPDKIKRAITSVLAGYVLDETNPFVRNGEGTLRTLAKLVDPR
jgi:flavin-dependent dehydrogenase